MQIRSGLFSEDEILQILVDGLYLNQRQLNLNSLRKVNESLLKVKTLDELSKMYSDDKLLTKSWTDKTHRAYSFVFLIFSKVVNTKQDAKAITREDLQNFKAVLIKFPLLKPHQKNLELEEILKLNSKVISTSTAQKYLGYICSLFKWCEQEGHLNKSVAKGLFIKDDRQKESPRVPYSLDDLKSLFYKSTLYSSNLNKSLSEHPERVYLPLIAMYQGMRVNEIAQLYTEDLKLIDGVYCFDINTNTSDKRLKNESSKRIIPVHNELIELGLIEYWKQQQEEGRLRLWSNISLGLEGYSTGYRKWYGSFNRKEITQDRAKTFHSFRHLFTHTLKQISLQEKIDHFVVKYLLGHSVSEDITMNVYTHGYNMKDVAEVINRLKYEGLALDELKCRIGSYRG